MGAAVTVKGVDDVVNKVTSSDINAYIDLSGYTVGEYEVPVNVEGKDVYNYTLTRIARKIEIGLKKFDRLFKRLSVAIGDETLTESQRLESQTTKERMENMLCKFL